MKKNSIQLTGSSINRVFTSIIQTFIYINRVLFPPSGHQTGQNYQLADIGSLSVAPLGARINPALIYRVVNERGKNEREAEAGRRW